MTTQIHTALMFIALILLSASVAQAEDINLERIAQIESGGNANAYNAKSGAAGMYQITQVCLDDYNRLNKAHYSLVDVLEPQIGAKIANWYLNERIPALLRASGLPDTLENRLVGYNAGVRALKRKELPKETKDYINKYNRGIK